ncbi:hypothetical protein Tco_0557440 [Tanacetum coccineum]
MMRTPLRSMELRACWTLCRWFKKMEMVFSISECAEGKKVNFAVAALQELRKLMTAEFCPMDEIQRVEQELWGLKISREMSSSRHDNLNEVVRMDHSLIDQRVQAMAKRIAGVLRGSGIYSKVEAIITTTTTTTTETIPTTTNIITEGSDKSFVSTNFSTLIDINPVRLDMSYEVELADGKIVSTNTVLKGYTLNLANHLFEIDLMSIKLGTFDVITMMDWLCERDAVIVCGNKIVRIPYNNKMLIVKGDRGASRLKIISCIKAQKYIKRGCQLYLAQVTEKEPTEKRLEDVPVIRNFPVVFHEDLL